MLPNRFMLSPPHLRQHTLRPYWVCPGKEIWCNTNAFWCSFIIGRQPGPCPFPDILSESNSFSRKWEPVLCPSLLFIDKSWLGKRWMTLRHDCPRVLGIYHVSGLTQHLEVYHPSIGQTWCHVFTRASQPNLDGAFKNINSIWAAADFTASIFLLNCKCCYLTASCSMI